MFNKISELLQDQEKGIFVFEAFSLCHIVYMLAIIGFIVVAYLLLKNKSQEQKSKAVSTIVSIALGLYSLDFFLMPFSEGEISIVKLPFHICTLMSIMCFLARHTKFFAKFKTSFTMMGLIGALMYLTYPSGVASADGYSYRIAQTVLYHGLMIAQGVLALALGDVKLSWKGSLTDLFCIICMSIWAVMGNVLYGVNTPEGLDSYNWFFVVEDPFGLFDAKLGQFIMPFGMVAAIFGVNALIYAIYFGVKKLNNKGQAELVAE